MSPKHHFGTEVFQNIFEDRDLIDDSTGNIPMVGLKTPTGLRDRFLQRLSKMAAASATMHEAGSQQSIEIYLTRNVGSPQLPIERDHELRQLIQSMQASFAVISTQRSDPACEQAEEELWDSILVYSYLNIDHIVESMQKSFNNYQTKFEDLATRMFGVCDINDRGSRIDRELGDLIISLYHLTGSYDKSMKQLHALIHFASGMTKSIDHLQDRLRYLLQKAKFAGELYELICTLGFPERAYSTFVRVAKTSPAFAHTTFHLGPNAPLQKQVTSAASTTNSFTKPTCTPPKTLIKQTVTRTNTTPPKAITTSPPTTAKPVRTAPPQPQQSTRHQASEATSRVTSSATQSMPASRQADNILALIRPYLTEEDQAHGLARLQSASKQNTAQLIAYVLQDKLLPISSTAFYTFGFVTAHDQEEERHLGGLYATILKEAQDSQAIFRELAQAINNNTLVTLFDIKEYGHFRNLFPRLEAFLTTPPEQRSTVWKLKQFINDINNTVPSAPMQRDYGFKFCRPREEVQKLKDIYWRILNKAEPMDLHNACIHGRLHEFATMKGFYIDIKDKRLMQNDYPAPCVGFDTPDGTAAYRGAFYRRRL